VEQKSSARFFSITKGYSLIEVLMSLALLSLALLGVDAMEIQSLHENRNTYFFNVAINQFQSMRDRLHVLNKNSHLDDAVSKWQNENKIVLPQGYGQVIGSYPDYVVTLFWGEASHTECQKMTVSNAGCLSEKVFVAN
jgi:prepilin-type N-terminal cleavage/methylation domain-containing protein